jgi:hypothetical protein
MQKTRVLWPILLLLVLLPALALAAPGNEVPDPNVDASAWLKALYEALTSKSWGVVVGLAMVGLTYPIRKWGSNVVPWFKTKLGGVVLAFTLGMLATLGVAAAAGAKITLVLVAVTASSTATAAGLWGWIKDYLESKSKAPA